MHARPLFDALAQGFQYIEVDIHLIGSELYVSHDHPAVPDPMRTLERLYLQPLEAILRSQGGKVFPGTSDPLYLVIDIKTEAAETYERLKEYLAPFRQWVTEYVGGEVRQGAVDILLSGNRPVAQLLGEESRWMALDGRLEDLGKGIPSEYIPVISENFRNIFGPHSCGGWQADGQWQVFRKLVRLAEQEGKRVRLWASPEEEACWRRLLSHGAGILNVDDMGRLRRFLQLYRLGRPHQYEGLRAPEDRSR